MLLPGMCYYILSQKWLISLFWVISTDCMHLTVAWSSRQYLFLELKSMQNDFQRRRLWAGKKKTLRLMSEWLTYLSDTWWVVRNNVRKEGESSRFAEHMLWPRSKEWSPSEINILWNAVMSHETVLNGYSVKIMLYKTPSPILHCSS